MLKLQYFGHLMQRTDSLKKTMMLGKMKVGEEDDREWTGWRHHRLNGHISLSKLRELVMNGKAWHAVVHGVTKSQTWLSDWTELNWIEVGHDPVVPAKS